MLRIFLVWALSFSMAFGAVPPPVSDLPEVFRLNENRDPSLRGNVFIYGDQSLDNLIPVRVMGSVVKAGVHYIPKGLDLVTLMSLAGGTGVDADIENVTIKRKAKGENQVIVADLEELVSTTDGDVPMLEPDDTVYVPHRSQLVSDGVSRTISLFVGLASIAVSVFVISRGK